MIKNDKQYKITKSRLKEFKKGLKNLSEQEMDPAWRELSEGSIKSQIEDFEKEIHEYELLKQGNVHIVRISRLQDVNEALIKARICKKWTQAELAQHLNMKEQQIQRYEKSNYESASCGRVNEVAAALGVIMSPTNLKIVSSENMFPEINQEIVNLGFAKMQARHSLLL